MELRINTEGDCLKREGDLDSLQIEGEGGLGKKEGRGAFEEGGELIPQCTL